ncbi:MAG: helix-turn-helix domain-containing protein [Vicinamibacterales bacterium]
MEQLSARLKAAREARGRSLRDIAASTKISVVALEAVERNDFSRLPGGIFGRAFVRAYAIEVGLDPEAIVREFVVEVEVRERNAAKATRVPDVTAEDRAFLERQRQAARVLRLGIVVVIVLAAAVAVWRFRGLWTAAPPPAAEHPAAPAKVDYRPPPRATPLPSASPDTTSASSTAGAAPPAPTTPTTNRLAIEFSVTSDCWVQVTADGLIVLERVLKAGERETFSADHEIALDVGNAGALTWSINGKSAKPLGKSGVHRQARVTLANVAEFLQ